MGGSSSHNLGLGTVYQGGLKGAIQEQVADGWGGDRVVSAWAEEFSSFLGLISPSSKHRRQNVHHGVAACIPCLGPA